MTFGVGGGGSDLTPVPVLVLLQAGPRLVLECDKWKEELPHTPAPSRPKFKPPQSVGAGCGLFPPFLGTRRMAQRMHGQSSDDLCDQAGPQ